MQYIENCLIAYMDARCVRDSISKKEQSISGFVLQNEQFECDVVFSCFEDYRVGVFLRYLSNCKVGEAFQ